jgi:hypothetical protein
MGFNKFSCVGDLIFFRDEDVFVVGISFYELIELDEKGRNIFVNWESIERYFVQVFFEDIDFVFLEKEEVDIISKQKKKKTDH